MSIRSLTAFAALSIAVASFVPAAAFAGDRQGNRHEGRHENSRDRNHDNHKPPRPIANQYTYRQPRVVYYNPPRVHQRVVYYRPVPQRVVYHLQPLPRGYYYSMADSNSVYMVSQNDNMIAQIINLLAY